MTFDSLRLAEPICQAVSAEGYQTPTPIQAQTIPHVLKGRDVLGCAQTGTGKTAAFALPMIDRLSSRKPGKGRPIRALILSPTRELAAQIHESFTTYGRHTPLRHLAIFGGVNQNPQTKALRRGVDVLVATPGRLLDLMQQGFVDLRQVETFVLDEADRMLDMGFIPDIRRISAKLPEQRQTLLFSATMPRDIRDLAQSLLRDPVEVQIAAESPTAERIEQSVYHVSKKDKPVLLQHVLKTTSISRALVFTRTKHGADRVVKQLGRAGVNAAAIHGNKTQANRKRTLANFRSGRTAVLVATDIAARGIDVDDVSHVINFDLPNESETYVHRIGRTGRAGASGTAIAFCAPDEQSYLGAIERLTREPIRVAEHEELSLDPALVAPAPPAKPRRGGRQGRGGGKNRPRQGHHHPRASASGPQRRRRRGAGKSSRRPA
ncbi:MAG: DEAD/DEAH box helicase [Phycisphaeraceae bacterium]